MLSPNATNRVRLMVGGATTVTSNVQAPVRCRASVAVQVTVVAPIGKTDRLAGVQDTLTGGAPLDVVAESYTTTVDWLLGDCTDTALGHVIRGVSGD
jgi:hypothetical protein